MSKHKSLKDYLKFHENIFSIEKSIVINENGMLTTRKKNIGKLGQTSLICL